MNPGQGGWLILLTLVASLLLAIVHLPTALPAWTGWLRPAWAVLVLFFWIIHAPHRLGLIACWLFGAFLDVLRAEPLGLNGLIFATLTFIGWQFYERLRMYSVLQHAALLFLLVLGAEGFRAAVLYFLLDAEGSFGIVVTAGVSAVCWPLVYGALSALCRTFRVE